MDRLYYADALVYSTVMYKINKETLDWFDILRLSSGK